ncbi:hypothetical protein COUCH_37720 [Couchioplanes caeruleus]|uniref:hypothetical protein n=1 Tax=Couchioplanes caeruleus TaxID=56438 RepID=UPI0020BD56B4|nr:hypothetical protein [Couchioplanes caeruleus]UQU64617.1 hypothetical protein COUCH_37720 [Couchioplanes caeruleus]
MTTALPTVWPWLLAAALLVAAAVVAGWPARPVLRRLAPPRSRPLPSINGSAVRAVLTRRPRRALLGAAATAAVAGLVLGGPVAALVGAVYAALGARGLTRRLGHRQAAVERSRSLDELSALAADLRAGLGFSAMPAIGGRLGRLAGSAQRLSDRTGAPTADLVDRIEADARAADRARGAAAAQAAGAQATALLLAALPLGGVALGYSIGVDPLQVLLHTPIGAACATGAALLQGAGLTWADRLSAGAAR